MEQYEQAVLDYICGQPDRFVNAQFDIPYADGRGGSCPDFLVLDFSETTVHVVEVTATADCRNLIGRVRERETRWFTPLRNHLLGFMPPLHGWDLHVTLFVRDEESKSAERAVSEYLDVSVLPLSKVLFSWNWDWQTNRKWPTNPLRIDTKRKRIHAI